MLEGGRSDPLLEQVWRVEQIWLTVDSAVSDAENTDQEKKIMQQQKTNWQILSGRAVVQPADVLRYTLIGVNNGDRPIKNLNINQPIPKGMVYVLNSATIDANNKAKISYSIDNGRNFVENPTVKVTLPNGKVETKPAPATAYTHIRWNFGRAIAAKATRQLHREPLAVVPRHERRGPPQAIRPTLHRA